MHRWLRRGFEVRNKQISVPRAIGFKANFGEGKESRLLETAGDLRGAQVFFEDRFGTMKITCDATWDELGEMNFDCNANMQKESELLPVIVSVFCSFCLKITLGHGACLEAYQGFFMRRTPRKKWTEWRKSSSSCLAIDHTNSVSKWVSIPSGVVKHGRKIPELTGGWFRSGNHGFLMVHGYNHTQTVTHDIGG